MIKFICLIGSLSCLLTLKAQITPSEIDTYLAAALTKFNIPDLDLIIVSNDSILYKTSIGSSANPNRPYFLGSVSKSLTALGVLKLVENRQLALDDIVMDQLPAIKFSTNARDITIRHLLNHTSGISKQSGFMNLPSLQQLKQSPASIKIHSTPGTIYEYSNLNYALLGLVIEKVSGLPFKAYMQQAVFTPLDMDNVLIAPVEELNNKIIPQYQYWGSFPIKSQQLSYEMTSVPAGFICGSATDMAKYLQMNLNQGKFNQKQILPIMLLQQMHTVWDQREYGYTMGWKQGKFHGRTFYQHLGSTATSFSGIFFLPNDNIGFVLLTNSNSLSFSEDLMKGILELLTQKQPIPPSSSEYYLRLSLVLLILFQIGRLIYGSMNIMKGKETLNPKKERKNLFFTILLGIGLIIGFPFVAKLPFLSFLKLQPDIGFVILLPLMSPLLLAIIRIVKGNPKS